MKQYKPTVKDIIGWLEEYNPDAIVQFYCGCLDRPRYWTSDYAFRKKNPKSREQEYSPHKAKRVVVDITPFSTSRN